MYLCLKSDGGERTATARQAIPIVGIDACFMVVFHCALKQRSGADAAIPITATGINVDIQILGKRENALILGIPVMRDIG